MVAGLGVPIFRVFTVLVFFFLDTQVYTGHILEMPCALTFKCTLICSAIRIS